MFSSGSYKKYFSHTSKNFIHTSKTVSHVKEFSHFPSNLLVFIKEQFKFNPYMKSLSGMIHSTYINKLLRDYDKNGASKLNPFPILDPSRVGGLNYDHPFMQELIK